MQYIYVATTGNDITGNGGIGTPYATLDKARDVARTITNEAVTVYLRAGTYTLTSSFALTSSDTRSATYPITYTHYQNEEVHIIGGKKLTPANWSLLSSGAIYDRLPVATQGNVYSLDMTAESPTIDDYGLVSDKPMQLFWSGAPMTLARYPNIDNDETIYNPDEWLLNQTGDIKATLGGNGQTFSVTNSGVNTWRYTGTGAVRFTAGQVAIGRKVYINVNTFDAVNNGYFIIVASNSASKWFDVINADGVENLTRVIGSGYGIYSLEEIKTPARSWFTNTGAMLSDAWIYGFPSFEYAAVRFPIHSVSLDKTRVYFTTAINKALINGRRFIYLNIVEELDSAGEYWIDRTTGIIYFWAPGNVNPNTTDSYVSILETPFIPCTNVNYTTFHGLIFEYTRGRVLALDTCDHVVMDGCIIRNIGANNTFSPNTIWNNYTVTFNFSTNCGVTNSTLYNLANGGISIWGYNWEGSHVGTIKETLTSDNNYIKNNIIHDFGQWNRSDALGINVKSVGCTISHNKIYNCPHTGIRFDGNNHLIEYNELYNVCTDTTDTGAINTGRDTTERGTVIRFNYIHDIYELVHSPIVQAGKYGIYFDEYASGHYVYGNIFDNIPTGVFIHWGRDNLIANNLFVGMTIKSFNLSEYTPPDTVPAPITQYLGKSPFYNDVDPETQEPLIWGQTYPSLFTILADSPGRSWGIKCLSNRTYSPGINWLLVSGTGISKYTSYLMFRNNWEIGNVLFDETIDDFSVKHYHLQVSSTSIVKYGFRQIPISDISTTSTATGPAWIFSEVDVDDWKVGNITPEFETGLVLYYPLKDAGQVRTWDSSVNDYNSGISEILMIVRTNGAFSTPISLTTKPSSPCNLKFTFSTKREHTGDVSKNITITGTDSEDGALVETLAVKNSAFFAITHNKFKSVTTSKIEFEDGFDLTNNLKIEEFKYGVSWLGVGEGALGADYGITFSGAGNSIVTIPGGALLSAAKSRTLSFWMKCGAAGGFIIDFLRNNSPVLGLKISSKKPILTLATGSTRAFPNADTLLEGTLNALDGQWHHWCLTILGSGTDEALVLHDILSAKLYIDNNEIAASATTDTASPTSSWGIHLLGKYLPPTGLAGSMDELMIWDRVLSNAEITDLSKLDIYEVVRRSRSNNTMILGMNF